MKPLTALALLVIVLGVGALLYQGVTYTTRETVVDIGPIHATADRQRTVPLPPVIGITALVAGVALLIVGRRQRA